jgi:hypothetical protein
MASTEGYLFFVSFREALKLQKNRYLVFNVATKQAAFTSSPEYDVTDIPNVTDVSMVTAAEPKKSKPEAVVEEQPKKRTVKRQKLVVPIIEPVTAAAPAPAESENKTAAL